MISVTASIFPDSSRPRVVIKRSSKLQLSAGTLTESFDTQTRRPTQYITPVFCGADCQHASFLFHLINIEPKAMPLDVQNNYSYRDYTCYSRII